MKCDSNLEQACKNKIKECEEKINPAPKPAPPAEITRLTIDRKSLEFGCETKTCLLYTSLYRQYKITLQDRPNEKNYYRLDIWNVILYWR